MNAKKKIVTQANAEQFAAINTKGLTPKKAAAMIQGFMQDYQSYYDDLWYRVAKKSPKGAAKLSDLVRLCLKIKIIPRSRKSVYPPGLF